MKTTYRIVKCWGTTTDPVTEFTENSDEVYYKIQYKNLWTILFNWTGNWEDLIMYEDEINDFETEAEAKEALSKYLKKKVNEEIHQVEVFKVTC